jgi:hypothetical protein
MTVKQLDILNIGLMALSCMAAFLVPFELFLFSYAVLGPLHYLTEIGWLHKRNYFATGRYKYDFVWLTLLCVLLISFSFILTDMAAESSAMVLFLAFTSALGMVLFDKLIYKIATVAIGFLIGLFFQKINLFIILFAVLLPTIIHVFVFTALFIIQGALKNKSLTGLLSVGFFVLCAVAFFVLDPTFDFYHVSSLCKRKLSFYQLCFRKSSFTKLLGYRKPNYRFCFFDQRQACL